MSALRRLREKLEKLKGKSVAVHVAPADLPADCPRRYVPIKIAGGMPCIARIDKWNDRYDEWNGDWNSNVEFTLGYLRKNGTFRANPFFERLLEQKDDESDVMCEVMDNAGWVEPCEYCAKNGDELCPGY